MPHRTDQRLVRRAGWMGLWVNVVLTAAKVAVGLAANSQALLADGAESATDIVTNAMLVLGVRFWDAPADARHPHGHKRLETFFILGIGVSMLLLAAGLGWGALESLRHGGAARPDALALAVALVTIVSKEWLFRWTLARARLASSPALLANAWHHRADALSSIPVAAAIALAWALPSWDFLDAVGAVVVCVFIAKAAVKLMKPAVRELLEEGAPEAMLRDMARAVCAVPGARGAHDLRTRYLGGRLEATLHLLVDPKISVESGHRIAHQAQAMLKETWPELLRVTIHVEPYSPEEAEPLAPGLSCQEGA